MKKLILAALLIACSSSNAEVFKCMRNGKMTISDMPCTKSEVDLMPKKLVVPPPPKSTPPVEVVKANETKVYSCPYGESFKPCLPDVAVSDSVKRLAATMCENRVKGKLKDPDSAKVTGLRRGDPDRMSGKAVRYYWMDVNAKNSFGAYTGMRVFGCILNSDESSVLFAGAYAEMVSMTDRVIHP